jgi:hypothetical protein
VRASVPPGEDEDRAGVEAIGLLRQRFGKGLAEDDVFHRRKSIDTAQHRRLLSLANTVC